MIVHVAEEVAFESSRYFGVFLRLELLHRLLGIIIQTWEIYQAIILKHSLFSTISKNNSLITQTFLCQSHFQLIQFLVSKQIMMVFLNSLIIQEILFSFTIQKHSSLLSSIYQPNNFRFDFFFLQFEFCNSMKHYEQFSMVHRVHKNVRKMLSEAREVIRSKPKIHSQKKSNVFLQEISPLDLARLSANFEMQHGRDSIERYRKLRTKERPYSLMVADCDKEERLHRTDNKSQNKQERNQKEKPHRNKQIKITQLIKEEAQLIDSFRRVKVRKNSEYRTILPQIINQRPKRSSTEAASSYSLTIPIEAFEKLTDLKIRQNLGIISPLQSSLTLQEDHKPKDIMKVESAKLNKKNIKTNINTIEKYEPWDSGQVQNDFFIY